MALEDEDDEKQFAVVNTAAPHRFAVLPKNKRPSWLPRFTQKATEGESDMTSGTERPLGTADGVALSMASLPDVRHPAGKKAVIVEQSVAKIRKHGLFFKRRHSDTDAEDGAAAPSNSRRSPQVATIAELAPASASRAGLKSQRSASVGDVSLFPDADSERVSTGNGDRQPPRGVFTRMFGRTSALQENGAGADHPPSVAQDDVPLALDSHDPIASFGTLMHELRATWLSQSRARSKQGVKVLAGDMAMDIPAVLGRVRNVALQSLQGGDTRQLLIDRVFAVSAAADNVLEMAWLADHGYPVLRAWCMVEMPAAVGTPAMLPTVYAHPGLFMVVVPSTALATINPPNRTRPPSPSPSTDGYGFGDDVSSPSRAMVAGESYDGFAAPEISAHGLRAPVDILCAIGGTDTDTDALADVDMSNSTATAHEKLLADKAARHYFCSFIRERFDIDPTAVLNSVAFGEVLDAVKDNTSRDELAASILAQCRPIAAGPAHDPNGRCVLQ